MKKRILAIVMTAAMVFAMAGCGSKADSKTEGSAAAAESTDTTDTSKSDSDELEATEITVFAAKSLNTVMEELITKYNETQPNVTVTGSYDSSGTLLTQIQEGAACDVFFSAAQKQMDTLQNENKLVVDGTRHNVVNNQVCVVTQSDSQTKVTGLDTLKDAANLAIADGSVPVGNYTRKAFIATGVLPETEDSSAITTQEISDALGGVEINECANVGAVTSAVSEGANEVGTVYKSDTYGFEDKLKILEEVSYDLTGDVIYPVAQIDNKDADELEKKAAEDFVNFLISDDAKTIFDKYYFDTNVTD
ncbi:molybdate ABC transporter substrate-binding protein [Hespellia stercorisuis]|uniref:Molybdate transport system substrate-binding protein n=1 Tax=Hespellia stercorisuis DSM 15480 TaxID=1121950 RepID=A0A1M6UDR2_9FIRM|nr:molybdate ABC transporter substrate-binding protein [Hespellia stercorisuis]SHK67319.1 molybdate transport system substrate-binding protein [Hespellia stercorisuis DSM 15480]